MTKLGTAPNSKLLKMRTGDILFLLLLVFSQTLSAAETVRKISPEAVSQGPLKLSADETISRDRGRIIDASGHVKVNYDMENGDTLESVSQFAKYDHGEGLGEVWGNPDALWKRKDPKEPATRLLAQKIILKIKDSELLATGNVSVIRSSSTLRAEKISYSNGEQKMTALGGQPEFTIRETNHHTRIRAQKIVAWTEKKEIHFSDHVKGVVLLKEEPKPE